ncbi:MAG: ArsC/Spx/MgsR family protein [Arcobacteraceae bacterium]
MKFTNYNITFYEKFGCAGNKKQKEILSLNGLSFHTQNILEMTWTKDTLAPFFDGLDKHEIINRFAPQIKNNEIDINSYSKDELLDMMCDNPILIKRPLLQIGQNYICGFDIPKINALLGIEICEHISLSTCQKSDCIP